MHLGDSDFIPVVHGLVRVLVGSDDARGLTRLVLLHHRVINHVELVIENNIAVYLANNVVFYQNKPVHFYVNCKSVRIETRTNFFVYFDENVVGWFLNGPLAVFFGHGIDQLKFLKRNLRNEVVEGAGIYFLCVSIHQVLQVLAICELRKPKVNDFIHELVDKHEVGS